MKLDEIQDTKRTLASLQSMYGPRPKKPTDPQKSVEAGIRAAAFRASKEDTERALNKLAQKYRGDQFDEFKAEALREVPQAERYVNLAWAFDTFNPERKAQGASAWDDYGKERASTAGVRYTGD